MRSKPKSGPAAKHGSCGRMRRTTSLCRHHGLGCALGCARKVTRCATDQICHQHPQSEYSVLAFDAGKAAATLPCSLCPLCRAKDRRGPQRTLVHHQRPPPGRLCRVVANDERRSESLRLPNLRPQSPGRAATPKGDASDFARGRLPEMAGGECGGSNGAGCTIPVAVDGGGVGVSGFWQLSVFASFPLQCRF